MLTPLELLDRLVALISPPRRYLHRTLGVLAPDAPLRAAVTALAGPRPKTPAAQTPTAAPGAPPPAPASASAETVQAAEEPIHGHPRAAILARFSSSAGTLSPNHEC